MNTETKIDSLPNAAPAVDKTPAAPAKLPKTTGEKYYDVLQFLTGKAFIIVVSAVIAYVARYGPEKYGRVPNVLKKFQDGFENLLKEKLGLGKTAIGEYFAGFAAATTLTMWGGNLFAPFLKAFENSKEKISNYFNEKYGKPGEVEIAHERLKDMPKQNWLDVLKGRAIGWVAVCSSFIGFDFLISKDLKKDVKNSRLAKFEEKVGRWFSRFSKEGKELGKIPLTQKLTEVQAETLAANRHYRVGRIVALDFFATSAAIIIWNAVSRFSAKKRQDQEKAMHSEPAVAIPAEIPILEDMVASTLHRDTVAPRMAEGYVKMASEPAATAPSLSA